MRKSELQKELEEYGFKICGSKSQNLLQIKDLSIGDVKSIFESDIFIKYRDAFVLSAINQTFPNVFDINFENIYYGTGDEKSSLQKSLEAFGYKCEKNSDGNLILNLYSLRDLLDLGLRYKKDSFKEGIIINQDSKYITVIWPDIQYGTEN